MDTDLFRPDALDLTVLGSLNGGRGRSPDQQRALEERLDSSKDPEELLRGLKEVSGAYDARAHDRDAGDAWRPSSART